MSPDRNAKQDILYSQKGPPTLDEMTGPEVQAALAKTDVLLLPVGATEAHGAHLPLGADSFEARENCRRAAIRLEALGCPVVIGPVIPFGTSSFHLGFAAPQFLDANRIPGGIRLAEVFTVDGIHFSKAVDVGQRNIDPDHIGQGTALLLGDADLMSE